MRLTVELMEPFWFAVTRLGIGSAFLFLILGLTGRLRLPRRQDLPAVFCVGIFMMGLYVSIVHVAVQYVPAGRGALLAYSTPLWVTPVAIIFLGEKMTPAKLLGIALGLGGLVVLFNPLTMNWSDPKILLGNGLCLLAAMSWSVTILYLRVHRWNLSPLQLAPWQLLLATFIALPFAVITEGAPDATLEPELWFLIAYGGLIGTAIALWTAQAAMRALPAVTVSIGLLGCPVIAMAISIVFLGEAPTASLIGGMVLILSGMALVNLPNRA